MSELRWRSVPREDLIWRDLDDDLVLRNARTGSTHLLEPLASEILRALAEAGTAMTVAELASGLYDGEASESEWMASIEAVLSEFERLGLAEPQRT